MRRLKQMFKRFGMTHVLKNTLCGLQKVVNEVVFLSSYGWRDGDCLERI